MEVLVGFASEHGSTRGVAERISTRLIDSGLIVETRPLTVELDPAGYHAFVLGSAVHNGAWMPQAADFVRRSSQALAQHPVWLFSVGLSRIVADRFGRLATEPRQIPEFLRSVHPVQHHQFAGAFYRDQTSFFGHLVFKALRGRYGDHRDWKEIDGWAEQIASNLTRPQDR
ncbi:flavodoxin domain-containing protein [Streptomyces sp. ODS28]|uniref:flavodoxin domain-containing protein n=1 Tax=Streptomyces sp. ODS28 TaxID=3136688 RepID=UPI0031E8DD6D